MDEDLPKKKAFLFGLNYSGTSHALHGCINDVVGMARVLEKHFGYDDIELFTDDYHTSYDDTKHNPPTKKNFLKKLKECRNAGNTQFFISFSGHGSQKADSSGDEDDGLDETLCTLGGRVVDDEIYKCLRKIDPETTVFLLIDACHSGSGADLCYTLGENEIEVNGREAFPGNVIMISGCRDNQTSADTFDTIEDGVANKHGKRYKSKSQGACSHALKKALKHYNYELPLPDLLLDRMRYYLKKHNYSQTPQLSYSNRDTILRTDYI